jgi:hypothetical protein
MPLSPDTEVPGAGETRDYARDHPGESPSEWGWHARWGRGSRIAGWVVAALLLLMTTTTNYQSEYHVVLWMMAAGLVGVQLLDHRRRRNRWRG